MVSYWNLLVCNNGTNVLDAVNCRQMTAPPKRRWFSFSLRTMFALVTVFGVYLGWQLRIVRERKAVLVELQSLDQIKDDYGMQRYGFRYEGLESLEAQDPTRLAQQFGRSRGFVKVGAHS